MHGAHSQFRLGFGIVVLLLVAPASQSSATIHEFLNHVDSDYALRGAPAPSALGSWQEAPRIAVCDDAPVSSQELDKALDWWRSLGHRFAEVRDKRAQRADWPGSPCELSEPHGYIVIRRLSPQEWIAFDSRAKTLVSAPGREGNIQWARIALQDEAQPRVLEHELGHALGYLDLEEARHLMHSIHAESGWRSRGLTLAERPSLVVTTASSMQEPEWQGSPKHGTWRRFRGVILCADAPIATRALERAIRWWERRGHNLRPLILPTDSASEAICSNAWKSKPTGYVVITGMVQEAEGAHLAVNHYHFGRPGKILWAKVFLRASNTEEVIAHELGHALGFAHVHQAGHLMYPTISGATPWGDEGLAIAAKTTNYHSSAE